jgi:hypothetical protein
MKSILRIALSVSQALVEPILLTDLLVSRALVESFLLIVLLLSSVVVEPILAIHRVRPHFQVVLVECHQQELVSVEL